MSEALSYLEAAALILVVSADVIYIGTLFAKAGRKILMKRKREDSND